MTSDATTGGPLGLDPELLSILACPDTHHSPLTVDEAASELLCTTCDRAFPVRDGIPVLLLDEARRRGGGAGEGGAAGEGGGAGGERSA